MKYVFWQFFRFLLQQFSNSPIFFGGKKLQPKIYANQVSIIMYIRSIFLQSFHFRIVLSKVLLFCLGNQIGFRVKITKIARSRFEMNIGCLWLLLDSSELVKFQYNIAIILKKKIMNKGVGNETDFIDIEGSEVSESTGYRYLDNKQIDKLYVSYNLMKRFSEDIPAELDFNLAQILENYAERALGFKLLPKNVMHILDKRIQRMLKNKKLKKNWSGQDTQILYWTFSHYCHIKRIQSVEQTTFEDWENISKLIPGSNPDSCMFKILSLKKIKLADQKWTQIESGLLLQIAMKYSKKNWRNISQELYKRNYLPQKIFRNAKQCKQHWVCYLNPELRKGSWSEEEDKRLINYIVANKGHRKWAQIAKIFGGRTENALKNRYTLIIQRLRRQKNSQNDLELLKFYLTSLEQRNTKQKDNNVIQQKKGFQLIKIKPQKIQKLNQNTAHLHTNLKQNNNRKNTVSQAYNGQVLPSLGILPQLNMMKSIIQHNSQSIDFNQSRCMPIYFNNQCFWVFPAFNTNNQ